MAKATWVGHLVMQKRHPRDWKVWCCKACDCEVVSEFQPNFCSHCGVKFEAVEPPVSKGTS